jgi:hypothetical protein
MSKLLNLFEQVIEKLDTEKKLEASIRSEMIASAEAMISEYTDAVKSEAEVTLKESVEQSVKEKAAEVLAAFDEYVLAENTQLFERLSKAGVENVQALKEKFEAEKSELISEQKKVLAEQLDAYLDATVAEYLPKGQVLNEARIARLETFYNNVRELSKVSNEELQETIATKVAEIDGEAKMLKEQLDAALKAKIDLKGKVDALEKEKFLAESTKDLRPKIAELVLESAAKLNLTETKSKFSTLVERAEGIIDQRRAARSDERKTAVREQVLNEHKKPVEPVNVIDAYASQYIKLSPVK